MRYLELLVRDESGQDLPEYAMLLGLVGLAVIVAVGLLGGRINGTFNDIGTTLDGAGVGS